MAFDGVPWAIGGGAKVTEDVARVFANVATRDAQGIALPGDFKVTALGTPAASVNIAPGGMVLRNVQAPGQSYIGRAGTVTGQAFDPNNTTAPRSDLLIARVIDPEFSPWTPYTDPNMVANGPYFEPHIVSGVDPATTLAEQVVTYSAEAIARIDWPAKTGVIDPTMVVDLRRLALPRLWTTGDVQRGGGTGADYMKTTDTAWRDWPANSLLVDVPRWATHAQVNITLNGIKADGPGDIDLRVALGTLTSDLITHFDYNGNSGTSAGYVEVIQQSIFGVFDVRALQGKRVICKPQGERVYATQNTGKLWFEPQQQVGFDIRFLERTV